MNNHPVNNEYVQNLVEGLLNEECSQTLSIDESTAHLRRQLKSKKISPEEKARLQAKLDAKEHDSEKRKEAAQAAADEEFGQSGGHHARMDLWAGNDQGDIRGQGGAERQPPKVRGQKLQTDSVDLARILKLKTVNENAVSNTLKKVTQGVKKFFAPLTDEQRKEAGLQDRHGYLTGKDVKAPVEPAHFPTDESGTVRTALGRHGTDKAPAEEEKLVGESKIKTTNKVKAKAKVKKEPGNNNPTPDYMQPPNLDFLTLKRKPEESEESAGDDTNSLPPRYRGILAAAEHLTKDN